MGNNKKVKNHFKKGITLIELIVVISILGILLSLVILSYGGVRDKAVATVCKYNFRNLNREYQIYLEDRGDQNILISPETEFLLERDSQSTLCPNGGVATFFSDYEFGCSIHYSIIEDSEEDHEFEGGDDGEVPYL